LSATELMATNVSGAYDESRPQMLIKSESGGIERKRPLVEAALDSTSAERDPGSTVKLRASGAFGVGLFVPLSLPARSR